MVDRRPSEHFFLVYASTASRAVSVGQLLELLATARRFNEGVGITGLLLYSPGVGGEAGTFLQVLEGDERSVRGLYGRIVRDPLHSDCTVIRSGLQLARRYGSWSMGFRNLAELDLSRVPGFNPIFQTPWTLQRILAEPDPILQLVYSFAGQ